MTDKGRALKFGANFQVTPGEVWLFLGYQLFMTLHPMEGHKQGYWAKEGDAEFAGEEMVFHNVGRHGLTYTRWNRLRRCFILPMQPVQPNPDPFRHIRMVELE